MGVADKQPFRKHGAGAYCHTWEEHDLHQVEAREPQGMGGYVGELVLDIPDEGDQETHIPAEIQYSVWSHNYSIIFICYVLDFLIRSMAVGNCVFVCLSTFSVYFVVAVSFESWYLSHPCRMTEIY